MNARIPICNGEFYDVPRQIQVQFEGEWYFLRSYFNDEQGDYSSFYEVYHLPFRTEDELNANPQSTISISRFTSSACDK